MKKLLLLLSLLISFDIFSQTINIPVDTTDSIVQVTAIRIKKVKKDSTVTPPGFLLVFQTGYNSLSDIINDHNQQGNGGLSTTIYKDGPGSFKSVPANVSSGIRSEVQYDDNIFVLPLEGVIEYDVYYEVVFLNNGHSFQFHPNTGGGSASPGLWHESGKFSLVNWKSGINTHHISNITIQKNHWYHIRMEYRFGSGGYFNFIVDGQKNLQSSWVGQVGDGSAPYLKVGVNMWQNQSSVVYYDNLKVYKKI